LEGAERGKKFMPRQMYKIKQELAEDDLVAMEVEWVGTLAIPFASVPADGQMKAFLPVFREFQEGKVIRQRNYDVSRLGSRRVAGKYDGTVLQFIFVVPFCHCPGRSMKAVWGCVVKVRASHYRSALLPL